MRTILMMAVAAGVMWGQAGTAKQPARKAPAAKAAAGTGDPAQWPIREIRVEGVKHFTAEQILRESGLKVGDLATKENFERARDRVLATGCIETIAWKYEPLAQGGGFRVTLMVSEPEQFLPWVLDRAPVERAAFAARVKAEFPLFGETITTTETVLLRVARVLQEMAAEKGIKEPMAGKVGLVEQNRMVVVFGPKAAPEVVAEVRFAGARAVDPRYLVKSLAGVAVGQPYVESDFRLVLENQIRPMYESVGRLRASFPKVTLAPAAGVRGVVATVQVEEGEPYILDNVEVRGTPLSEQDLKDAGQFKTGETVSFSAVGLGMARILDLLKAGGHMRASYKAQRQLNDAKKTVNLVVDVDPGPQFRFGKLALKGLDLETEPVIRKLWAMKPGDAYRGAYPDMFLSQIRERGIFDNLGETKAEVKPDDKTLLVDVLLIFQGEKPKEEKRRPEG